jgi:hypothetical protein
MDKQLALIVSGRDYAEMSNSLTIACQSLPRDLGVKLCNIRSDYLVRFGVEESYGKLNNRSVEQIFSEYDSCPAMPVETGEINGVKFALYDPPRKIGNAHE